MPDSVAPLHLRKLCVGCRGLDELRDRRGGGPSRHHTRSFPRRRVELLRAGSLYWIMQGRFAARQRLLAIEVPPAGGCDLVLDPLIVPVVPWPHRPFQGWRYLSAVDAPPDDHDIIDPEALETLGVLPPARLSAAESG